MARTVSPVILSATMLAARVICQAQVYSQNTIPVPHQADEISLQTYCASSNNTVTLSAAWYVSTNVLAKQPRWDDLTMEVPLSAHQACGVALTNLANRFPAIKSWAVETVWLQHYCADQVVPRGQAWYYRIEFSSQDPKRHNEFDHDFDVYLIQIVLLDGTVVSPRVVKAETSTNNPPTTGNPSTGPR